MFVFIHSYPSKMTVSENWMMTLPFTRPWPWPIMFAKATLKSESGDCLISVAFSWVLTVNLNFQIGWCYLAYLQPLPYLPFSVFTLCSLHIVLPQTMTLYKYMLIFHHSKSNRRLLGHCLICEGAFRHSPLLFMCYFYYISTQILYPPV